MLDKLLNPTPTIYKWDTFWVGFLPALLLPFLSFAVLYGVIAVESQYLHHQVFTLHDMLNSMQSQLNFLRISTVCCMPSAGLFFYLVNKNYNNASRAVVLTTMLYVMAIVIKDVS